MISQVVLYLFVTSIILELLVRFGVNVFLGYLLRFFIIKKLDTIYQNNRSLELRHKLIIAWVIFLYLFQFLFIIGRQVLSVLDVFSDF